MIWGGKWAEKGSREKNILKKMLILSIVFCPYLALESLCVRLILECKPAPNIALNIQPGANHLGTEDFELMLEEVN